MSNKDDRQEEVEGDSGMQDEEESAMESEGDG